MFDVLSKDLFKAPLAYAAINGTDVFATKVKLAIALPWLEVVCESSQAPTVAMGRQLSEEGQAL